MEIIHELKRIQKIHELILSGKTGTPDELARYLNISRRQLYYTLDELRNLGAEISFNRNQKTFCYINGFQLNLSLEISYLNGEDERDITGGFCKSSKFFEYSIIPCSIFARK